MSTFFFFKSLILFSALDIGLSLLISPIFFFLPLFLLSFMVTRDQMNPALWFVMPLLIIVDLLSGLLFGIVSGIAFGLIVVIFFFKNRFFSDHENAILSFIIASITCVLFLVLFSFWFPIFSETIQIISFIIQILVVGFYTAFLCDKEPEHSFFAKI